MIRGLEAGKIIPFLVGEIIPFPVGMIPFPVLKINSELLGSNEKYFVKEVFWDQMKIFCKRTFLIRGLEVGEIIPFPVWIIPFPVLKINFETLGTNEKHFVKEVF